MDMIRKLSCVERLLNWAAKKSLVYAVRGFELRMAEFEIEAAHKETEALRALVVNLRKDRDDLSDRVEELLEPFYRVSLHNQPYSEAWVVMARVDPILFGYSPFKGSAVSLAGCLGRYIGKYAAKAILDRLPDGNVGKETERSN